MKQTIQKLANLVRYVLTTYDNKRYFGNFIIKMPKYDCDVTLRFPSGKEVVIQTRPSNAEGTYLGSLDFILPCNMQVTNWHGDDMSAAPSTGSNPEHIRLAKQLVAEIP